MITLLKCPDCGAETEIEAENLGAEIFCSNCARIIHQAPAASAHPAPIATAPAPVSASRLIPCIDCAHPISPRAAFCPTCGSLQKGQFHFIFEIVWRVNIALLILAAIGSVIGFVIYYLGQALKF